MGLRWDDFHQENSRFSCFVNRRSLIFCWDLFKSVYLWIYSENVFLRGLKFLLRLSTINNLQFQRNFIIWLVLGLNTYASLCLWHKHFVLFRKSQKSLHSFFKKLPLLISLPLKSSSLFLLSEAIFGEPSPEFKSAWLPVWLHFYFVIFCRTLSNLVFPWMEAS